MIVFIDLESYNDQPIKAGHFKYSETVEILMVSWAVDDGPVELWDAKKDSLMPPALRDIIHSDCILIAHNSSFEAAVFAADLVGATIDPKRWRCTMAQAYAHGLPGSLDNLGAVLGLKVDQLKSRTGANLIRLFCMPPPKHSKRTERATAQTHPKEWAEFCEYCKQDIVATREIYKKLPKWNYQGFELDLWHLDQVINARGVNIDLELANAAIKAVDREQEKLRGRTSELTLGDIDSTTRRDALLKHILEAYGVELPDMQASTLERRIEDPDLPEGLRELLGIRLQATTSSTAKYKRLVKSTCSDGRLRGALQWCGASRTGRDSGRLFQPQNLPRPTMKQSDIELGIEALKADCADLIYPNVMQLASNTLRAAIAAPEGKKLLVADLSNIEGRYAAWLAGEQWKLDAFRAYDEGTGPDLYALAYAKSFHVTPESVMVDKENGGYQRQIGKTMELALGFGGGVGSFVTFALNFGIDLDVLVEEGYGTLPKGVRKEAEDFWEYAVKQKRTLGLDKNVFITCDSLKRLWRNDHPNIVRLWKEIENSVIHAIAYPNSSPTVGKLKTRRVGNWLRVLMPSGRCLCYPHPQASDKSEISFMGTDQYTRHWQRIKTYGPKIFENCVQGGARDVFMYGVVNAEKAGYECTMRIHDEIIAEVPDNENYTVKELCELMTTNIPWTEGLPLAASGFQTYRYRKND